MAVCIVISLSLYFLDLIDVGPIASVVIYPDRNASATLDVPVNLHGLPYNIYVRFLHKMSKGELRRFEAQISIHVAEGMPGSVVTPVGGEYGDDGFGLVIVQCYGPTKLVIKITNPQEWPDKVEIEVQNNYFFM